MNEARKKHAYHVAVMCLNTWDNLLLTAKRDGTPIDFECLVTLRKTLDDIETLDPGWALMLRETYADYL